MPDRILRDEILESDRWLLLPRNTHRLAFICLIPKGDALGNMDGADGSLWRLWRDPLKLESRSAIPEILEALVSADLIRLYLVDNKRFIHIPRYRQRLRYLGRLYPQSPWTSDEEKHRLNINSPCDSQVIDGCAPAEVKRSEVEVKGSEVSKRNVVQTPSRAQGNNTLLKKGKAKVDNEEQPEPGRWDATEEGIMSKVGELGIDYPHTASYYDVKRLCWAEINARKRGVPAPVTEAAQALGKKMKMTPEQRSMTRDEQLAFIAAQTKGKD